MGALLKSTTVTFFVPLNASTPSFLSAMNSTVAMPLFLNAALPIISTLPRFTSMLPVFAKA